MKSTINIAYIVTQDMHYMTIVSMQSVLASNLNNQIRFFIIYDNLFEQESLSQYKAFENKKNCAEVICINISNYSKTPVKGKYNSLYLFDFPEIIDCKKVLLLSTYSIITCDLRKLYDTDLSNNSCAAPEFIDNNEILKELKKYTNNKIFRVSTLLMNLELWKQKNYKQEFISKQNIINESFLFKSNINEVFFNLIIKDCKKIDLTYDYCELWSLKQNQIATQTEEAKYDYKKFSLHLEQPSIITFSGTKPCESCNCKNSYINLWWNFAVQTEIYENIKQLREINKYKLSSTTAQNSFQYGWLLSRIWPYIKPYTGRIILGFLIAIPLGLLDGVTAFALKPYMDYVIGGTSFEFSIGKSVFLVNSLQMAYIIPAGIIIFAGIQGVLRYLNSYISSWTSQKITNDVKLDLFHKLIHMHPQFFDDNPSGIVISRYIGDPQTASAGIIEQIKTITTSICGALGLIAVMLYSSWELALVGILVLCISFIPVMLIRKRIRETSNKNMVIGGNITTNINETYSGNKVIAAYGLQERQENYFRNQIGKSFDINMALTKRTAWMSPMMYQIASIGIAVVLGFGTFLINSGKMTSGAFASFTTSLLLLYKPVKTLGNTLTGIQNLFVAMGRVFELFDLNSAIKNYRNPKQMETLQQEIKFENVTFEYTPQKTVLKNINLSINKNETLAIVGNSGGGKSTLVNLIPRFYDLKSGSIKFDGVDIKEFSISSLRKNISMVFQDNFLFSGTIKENILMGNTEATSEELMNAIKAAHLQDMIAELPDGLDTKLGERGLNLSGGQRQRVAIARAILRNAPIVILDEATSALDNKSEAIVQKAMDNLMKNKTVFIIAHRLSTIKNANRIAVLNEGNLVELGSHDELIQIENGYYKNLYNMQFRKQEKLLT